MKYSKMENKEMVINVYNLIGDEFATEPKDGDKIFTLISKSLKEKKHINVSFTNIKLLTTAFLNTAIGQLYRDFSSEDIKNYLSISNLNDSGLISLKRVVDTAKVFYSLNDEEQDNLKKEVKDILDNE